MTNIQMGFKIRCWGWGWKFLYLTQAGDFSILVPTLLFFSKDFKNNFECQVGGGGQKSDTKILKKVKNYTYYCTIF